VQTLPGALQVEHLQALKDELRATLDRVEAQEKNLSRHQQPQTLAQVDEIEKKLNDALEELRQRRTDLQNRERGGGR
jgi:predicted  nucleic acid-binding Zn-ribbon protein